MLLSPNKTEEKMMKRCRLCSNGMCFVITFDEEGWENIWWHCHDCDMRNCHEEAGQG